jgi:hypothetical protein
MADIEMLPCFKSERERERERERDRERETEKENVDRRHIGP